MICFPFIIYYLYNGNISSNNEVKLAIDYVITFHVCKTLGSETHF